MKKYAQKLLMVGALCMAPLFMMNQANAAVPYGETILAVGDSGNEVSLLQKDLKVLGYFTNSDITGYYGPITEASVKTFQKDHHLMQNGKVGLTTGPIIQQEAAIKRGQASTKSHYDVNSQLGSNSSSQHLSTTQAPNQIPAPTPSHVPYGETILSVGDSGQQVTLLQEDLKVIGYFADSNVTGYYGSITETSVKAFQKDHHIVQNGEVGMTTGPMIQAEAQKKRAALQTNLVPQIINTAKKYIGTPFLWGGTTPAGFDCSGFVGYVLSQNGIDTPRTSQEMYQSYSTTDTPKAGDLVFFTTYAPGATHVGIYLGNNQFISAADNGVTIDSLNNSYWSKRYLGAGRVL